ncbi:MAG: homocysteine S-methyltransferase family protein [Actinomycetia bacterium]|nr:homocysteine S-methyltransferase family protein [Actinomycetes bacterium]
MPDIQLRLGREVLVIDGATGTMLERAGIPAEQCPAQLCLLDPDIVLDIHRNYVLAGADCVTTNSFGGTRAKLAHYGLDGQMAQINRASVRIARASGAQHVLADVGPSGRVLAPVGDAEFDDVYADFFDQVQALASEGPDAILIETMTDIAEARCAVLAARAACDLPVFVTVSFGSSGRMDLSGTDPETAAVILAGAGAHAVGINCGLGPEQMLPLVEGMAAATSLPIIVQPNAGLPRRVGETAVFPGTAEEMGHYAERFAEAGASLIGSCCGSTPAFTGAIADRVKERAVATRRPVPEGVAVAGPRRVVRIGAGQPLAVIGERINPTGKKALVASLASGSMSVVRDCALTQQQQGAHLLDVNVGAPEIDATAVLPQVVEALEGIVDLPLVLDNTDPVALERALKVYPGRALINSVNGSDDSMACVLPLAKRYGAAVLVLALDQDGIPSTAEGRVAIVDRVCARAHELGLTDQDLLVDCLVLTAAADPHGARATLDAVHVVSHDRGLATVLGVSNVSHGLPGRASLNATYLAMAAGCGLDAAIVNPGDAEVMRTVAAVNVLRGADELASAWIARVQDESKPSAARPELFASGASTVAGRLAAAVEHGDADSAPVLVEELLQAGMAPGAVVSDVLTPAIQRLGDAYGRGDVFLPQLIAAAGAMKAAVEAAKAHLPAGEDTAEGRVVFGTVKGDIHSIGKDICISMLESRGFAVSDLGVDVAPETFARAASEADVVCLSALMTTTLGAMEDTVELLAETGVPVLVGGAVVTEDYAQTIGAGYAPNAPGCVEAVRAAIEGVPR